METQVPTSAEPGVSRLVKGIADDIGDLIKEQFLFARKEVQVDLRKSKEAATVLALGVGTAFLGILLTTLMLVHLLHWLTLPPGAELAGLPLWGSYAIFAVLFLGCGGALIQAGRKKFSSFNPLPEKTVETMKENVQWIANSK